MLLKKYFCCLFLCWVGHLCSGQIGIDIVGTWSYSVSETDITEAGSDFSGTYTSAANQILVNIPHSNNGNFNYDVHIQKQDIDWHTDLDLYVRRTGSGNGAGNGNGNGFVQLGTNYQLVTSTNQFFFKGRKKRQDIPIQYEIRNVSVLMPAKSYETTIIYTVTEL